MDCKLSNESESSRIADIGIQTPKFGRSILHEVDSLDRVNSGTSSPFYEALIGGFQNSLLDAWVAYHD